MSRLIQVLLYWYSFVFLSTEVLSFFRILEVQYVIGLEIVFWLFIVYFSKRDIRDFFRTIHFKSKLDYIPLVIAVLTFIQGIFSAPSTTDSMVYHLPRVVYWIQEQTVFQNIIVNPHDFKAPFGEYILTHLYFMTNSDRILFFSQWLAYICSIYLIGLIALQLGSSERLKQLVRILCATLPIAVMQASSTQIDMVLTLFVLMSLYISLIFRRQPTFGNALFLGVAIGLGILTKATFVIYMLLPIGILSTSVLKNPRKVIIPLTLAAFLALLIQMRFVSQNIQLYQSPMGQHIKQNGYVLIYSNESFALSSMTSNLIKNIFTQVPFPLVNGPIQNIIIGIHRYMGVEVDDPRTTICCGVWFMVPTFIYPQEDIVANPFHLFLIGMTGCFLLIFRPKNKFLSFLYILNIISFLVFSIYLKWQPFHSRLEIPFFMIGALLSVLILYPFRYGRYLINLSILFSILIAFAVIVLNVSRPFVSYKYFFDLVKPFSVSTTSVPETFYSRPRTIQYFNASPFWYNPYQQVTRLLRNDQKIEVTFDLMDDFEYPFWILMREKGIDFTVKPLRSFSDNAIILSTSKTMYKKEGYKTTCFKTTIDYGYACISQK